MERTTKDARCDWAGYEEAGAEQHANNLERDARWPELLILAAVAFVAFAWRQGWIA
jgi:hypothetical protein